MSHIVDLQFALGFVLFLEVSREMVEDGAAAAALHVQAWWPADRMDLQAGFLI